MRPEFWELLISRAIIGVTVVLPIAALAGLIALLYYLLRRKR